MRTAKILAGSALLAAITAAAAWASPLRVVTDVSTKASVQSMDVVYSDDFPEPEELPAAIKEALATPSVVTPGGAVHMGQAKGYDNYHFSGAVQLNEGHYLITVKTKEVEQDGKKVFYYAKSLFSLGNTDDLSVITKPTHQKLEIIPLANPKNAHKGDTFPVQVLYSGKPLAGAAVTGITDTQESDAPLFSGTTDEDGKVAVTLASGGLWALDVEKEEGDALYRSSLTFRIPLSD